MLTFFSSKDSDCRRRFYVSLLSMLLLLLLLLLFEPYVCGILFVKEAYLRYLVFSLVKPCSALLCLAMPS